MDQPMSNSDSVEGEDYSSLSAEEINSKIKKICKLCLQNKINSSNAFDIDMIDCFKSWIAKKITIDNVGVELFREVVDYLDACEKVYSLRVDNASLSTKKLVEQFKILNSKLNTVNEKEQLKMLKPKKSKVMLTTSEKLKCNTTKTGNLVFPSMQQINLNLDCNKLFETNRPADYMSLLYSTVSVEEEKNRENVENLENAEKSFFLMPDLENELAKGVICPNFSGFVSENNKVNNVEELLLENMENRFDPENNVNQNSFLGNENQNECGSSSNDGNRSQNDGLLECIDDVDRDYSFFNPSLLANWNGPEEWKTQAMSKALKSCNPNDVEESVNEQTTKPSTSKRCTVKKDKVSITWLTMDQIEKKKLLTVEGNEFHDFYDKWQFIYHIAEEKPIPITVKHKFEFLKYYEIFPDWSKSNNNIGDNSTNSPPNNQCIDSYDAADGITPNDFDNNILDENDRTIELNESNELLPDNDLLKEFQNESRVNIAELKIEISEIIDQECIEIDSDNEWSCKLLFSNLLKKLKINERKELNISMVFVSLLHLATERGLKLFEEPSATVLKNKLCIYKPLNKM